MVKKCEDCKNYLALTAIPMAPEWCTRHLDGRYSPCWIERLLEPPVGCGVDGECWEQREEHEEN